MLDLPPAARHSAQATAIDELVGRKKRLLPHSNKFECQGETCPVCSGAISLLWAKPIPAPRIALMRKGPPSAANRYDHCLAPPKPQTLVVLVLVDPLAFAA